MFLIDGLHVDDDDIAHVLPNALSSLHVQQDLLKPCHAWHCPLHRCPSVPKDDCKLVAPGVQVSPCLMPVLKCSFSPFIFTFHQPHLSQNHFQLFSVLLSLLPLISLTGIGRLKKLKEKDKILI